MAFASPESTPPSHCGEMQMKKLIVSVVVLLLGNVVAFAATPNPTYQKLRLSDKFYAEGAYYGDFNHDGKLDVVAGPFWYEGPDFQKKHEYRPAQVFDPNGYSDNFLTYTGDFNNDGWTDILVMNWPGKDSSWYENPAGKEGHWKSHVALKNAGNESPMYGDVNGDGRPEALYNIDGYLGYATYDPAKPNDLWKFHAITPHDKAYFQYTHGIGYGDINGDGRCDMVEMNCWWEQPANPEAGKPWIKHPFHFADAAAQMLVYDVDGDGLNDIITAWHCHLYGLVWYKQVRNNKGEITWKQNVILPSKPDMNSKDLRISQLHAFDLVDINGDGLMDFVTGKRFWAHGPQGDIEPNAPAVLYWFELQRDKEKGAHFIPHQIDNDSGVGTQVAAKDLNGDGVPDIIVSNKKGTFLHLSQPAK
jgi:hypothetical protein